MTLEILNLQVSEITIRVGQTMEGQKIRVLIREVADLESAIIDRVVDAVASSTDVYINGLEEWVKYILQVATYDAATYDPENPEAYLAYDEKIFTTKRVGAVRDGQLIKMPVLPPNFALFNWDDWPTSRSALVSGGMTHEFQRGCWNSIVDTLYNAFMDAGLHWWGDLVEGGLKAEDTKILIPYDGLYAYKINALLDEIYRKAKFPFVWEDDRNFRGYVGRRHFVGVSEVGEEADLVYPEYILELVRRLNLLLQIMRGWGPALLRARVLVELTTGTMFARIAGGRGRRVRTDAMGVSTDELNLMRLATPRRLMTDAMGVRMQSWQDFTSSPAVRLQTDAMSVWTWGTSFMQHGIPKRLRTDKSQVGTSNHDAFFNAPSLKIYTDKSEVNCSTWDDFLLAESAMVAGRQKIIMGEWDNIRKGRSAALSETIEITTPWHEHIRLGEGIVAQMSKRQLSWTKSERIFRQGTVRRLVAKEIAKSYMLPQSIRMGTPGRRQLHGSTITREINRMMGGTPKYLQVDRSLCNTELHPLFRDAESLDVAAKTQSVDSILATARAKESLAANSATMVRDVPMATPRLGAPQYLKTDRKTAWSKAGGGVRNGTPGRAQPRGYAKTDKSVLTGRQGLPQYLKTSKRNVSTEKSRLLWRQGTPGRVLGRVLSDTENWDNLRYSSHGRFLGRGLSDTRKNWGNIRYDNHGRMLPRGQTWTGKSRMLLRYDNHSRMLLRGHSKADKGRLLLKYDDNGRMHLRGHSGTDKSKILAGNASGGRLGMDGYSITKTTGAIDLGTPVGMAGHVKTPGVGKMSLGAPTGQMVGQAAATEMGNTQLRQGVSGVLHGVSVSAYSRISFRASEQVELEMTRHKVASFFKAPTAETAPGAVAAPRGRSQMKATALKIDAAVVKSLQLDAADIPLLQSSPDISPSLGREVAAVVLPIRTKYGKPGLFLGVPKYTSWQTVPLVTDYEGQAEQGRGEGFGGEDKFVTGQRLEAQTADSGVLAGSGFAKPKVSATVEAMKIVSVAAEERTTTETTAAVGTAWLPPVWIDGGLWIRQSHSVTQNENGELVIT